MSKYIFLLFTMTAACLSTAQESYSETIPGSEVSFDLQFIPAGELKMGEPEKKVILDAFWMGSHEVTYDLFVLFKRREFDSEASNLPGGFQPDAVTRPTPPYEDMTWGMGTVGGYPAVSMTQQAALRFCHWLYQKTGRFYRLPTEAEWEYACRAGTGSTYFFGENEAELGDYAWHLGNTESFQKTGLKEPNPWGLYDMYGNVVEWTLDSYQDDYLVDSAKTKIHAPWIRPTKKHYRTLKGGCYLDGAEDMTSGSRLKSDRKWQARDPQIPKSKWWLTDGSFVGFRLLRPVGEMSREEVEAFFEEAIVD